MKNKSLEWINGFLIGLIICLLCYACTHNPLNAEGYGELGTMFNPMYVKIVD